MVEYCLLQSVIKDNENPVYCGFFDNGGQSPDKALTWVDTQDGFGLTNHIKNKLNKFRAENDPFTRYPVYMEINTLPYKDKIYKSTDGEGLVIAGPIALDDITLLLTSRKNILSLKTPRDQRNSDAIQRWTIYNKDLIDDIDLITKWEKKPDKIASDISLNAYGPRFKLTSQSENNSIELYRKLLIEFII